MKKKTKDFEIKFDDFNDEEGVAYGKLADYGSVDQGGDLIIAGAFSKCLEKRTKFPYLFQHSPDLQIGVLEADEKEDGLYISCKYYRNTVLGEEKYQLAKANSDNDLPTGLSIGYKCIDRDWQEFDGGSVRVLKELQLFEGSQVTFPMNTNCALDEVKSEDINIRDVERALRDVMPNSKSKKYANVICKSLREEDGEDDKTTEIPAKDIEVENQTEPNAQEDETDNGDELLSELKNIFELETLKLKLETM